MYFPVSSYKSQRVAGPLFSSDSLEYLSLIHISAMLKGAGDQLENELKNVEFKELKMPYVANCNASYIYDNSQIKELLKKQISSPVKFMQSVEKMIDDGVDTFVEIGPGKTLSKFVKKINKDVTVINIEKVDDLEKLKGLEIC